MDVVVSVEVGKGWARLIARRGSLDNRPEAIPLNTVEQIEELQRLLDIAKQQLEESK